ncbi:hypothetical protein HUT18_27310 [Streptomyces sp. NA04227]|uniref:prenyltransferase/squalene oxidase repeat-containing protein n=1 Tax=Streptomyces sp. NA04227 TaxID=2742136 RepID=UPI001590476E|nr:prenyltransferase/squalene oxidase repeat-containing protein [Streptomyces sp. NA04227]QKW09549.1 hypothetical protein HUT18_27310 [Streptomyces sp. NA04227]
MAETGASALPSRAPHAAARALWSAPAPPPEGPGSPLGRAARFIWLTGRVLEQRLFAHLFLGGPADPVDAALTAYANQDGSFGHGLDPAVRGPGSCAAHAAHALRVLEAVGRCDGRRVELICRYLTSVSEPDGALAARAGEGRQGPTGVPVPRAAGTLRLARGELGATGPVVGLLHRNDVWHAWLFRATEFCWQAVDSLASPDPYEVASAVTFLDSAADRSRARAAADRLGRLVRAQRLVVLDPARAGASSAHYFPYDFAPRPDSLARCWFTDAETEGALDFLAAQQREDGGWPDRPAGSPGELRARVCPPAASVERRPMVTIERLRTLAAYGRVLG